MSKAHTSGRKGISPLQRHEILWAYTFLAPAFFFLVVLIVIPILFAFWISLHDWSLVPRPNPFIGVQNYLTAITAIINSRFRKGEEVQGQVG